MSEKKIIIANWKMNPESLHIAQKLYHATKRSMSKMRNIHAITLAPYVYIDSLRQMGNTDNCSVGAQDFFHEMQGAFTGEVALPMLSSLSVRYVLVGHSERRRMGETDELIYKKIMLALSAGMVPIVALGEQERDENGNYIATFRAQILATLGELPREYQTRIILAYEPVWAISTSKNHADATPEDCFEMITFTRKVLTDTWGNQELVSNIPILYGGSMNVSNAKRFLTDGGADGGLIGSASLSEPSFTNILEIAEQCKS